MKLIQLSAAFLVISGAVNAERSVFQQKNLQRLAQAKLVESIKPVEYNRAQRLTGRALAELEGLSYNGSQDEASDYGVEDASEPSNDQT